MTILPIYDDSKSVVLVKKVVKFTQVSATTACLLFQHCIYDS